MTEKKSEHSGPKQILVPLDGSPLADRALELAKDMALQASAHVTLLQAVHGEAQLAESMDLLAEKADFFQKHSISCEGKSLIGKPEQVILKASQLADLIVMSSHGHSQFDQLILGSTTEKVIRRSDCDVLVLRKRQPRLRDIRKILVPLDGNWMSHQALPKAEEMCTSLGASLLLARVHEADKLTRNLSSGKEETARQQTYLKKVATEIDNEISVETAHAVGGVTRELLKTVEKTDADLVVMTSHGRGGFNRWVCGSVTEALLRTSQIPILVVRARPKTSPAITPILIQPAMG